MNTNNGIELNSTVGIVSFQHAQQLNDIKKNIKFFTMVFIIKKKKIIKTHVASRRQCCSCVGHFYVIQML